MHGHTIVVSIFLWLFYGLHAMVCINWKTFMKVEKGYDNIQNVDLHSLKTFFCHLTLIVSIVVHRF